MLKPTSNIFRCNLFDRSFQGSLDPAICARPATAQDSLDFGDTLFNRIKIRRMRWQLFDPCPGRPNQTDRSQTAVETDLVQQDQIPRLQLRNQKKLVVQ